MLGRKDKLCSGGRDGVQAINVVCCFFSTISFVTSGFSGRCPPGVPLQAAQAGLRAQGGGNASQASVALTHWDCEERWRQQGGRVGGTQWDTGCSFNGRNKKRCLFLLQSINQDVP